MKTIGILGGMSWESTLQYYRMMNEQVQEQLGGHHSIEAIIYSVNFEEILPLVHVNDWDSIAMRLSKLAIKLETAGADFLIMTSNAIHKIFPQIESALNIPILHIVDPTALAIQSEQIKKVALLGTKVTMEEPFYKQRLQDEFGIEAIIPDETDRAEIHRIIFDELTKGIVKEGSRNRLIQMISKLADRGAEGIILGCTELNLLIHADDVCVQLFDTTALHSKAAVAKALSW